MTDDDTDDALPLWTPTDNTPRPYGTIDYGAIYVDACGRV